MAIPSPQTKHMLLSVTGMSPAVVTETLYGIAQRIKAGKAGSHWPDEIRIITTRKGKQEMAGRLVEGDWLRQVCEAVEMPMIQMADEHILVVPGASGGDVDDARSEEDHEALANFITRTVRDLTSDNNLQIHASIAGGRKTMTFYLGYAMSLFGRHFDRMSHVLISEDFESVRGFYFPGQANPDRFETNHGVIYTRDAQVTLADIPFIRMRHNLPSILTEKASAAADFNYRNLVDLINLGDRPEDIHLLLNPKEGNIRLKDGVQEVAVIELHNPVYMAIYTAMARITQKSGEERCRYVRTIKNNDDEHALYNDLAQELAQLVGHSTLKEGKQLFNELTEKISNDNEMVAKLEAFHGESIIEQDLTGRISEIRQKIEGNISENLKYFLIPSNAFDAQGSVVRKGKYYGLRLNPNQIKIIE